MNISVIVIKRLKTKINHSEKLALLIYGELDQEN